MKIELYCDGGARGNPGPGAYGCVVQAKSLPAQPGKKLKVKSHELSGFLGHTTNNQAEYQAVIHALQWIRDNMSGLSGQVSDVIVNLDSQLIVEQLNGNYKIKNQGLAPLYWQVRDLIVELGGRVMFCYIPRSQNKHADRLVNKVLDNRAATESSRNNTERIQ